MFFFGYCKQLLNSEKLSPLSKQSFDNFIQGKTIETPLLEHSLKLLSQCLYEHYDNSEVYILIDEYDTPLNAAYEKDYFDKLNDLLRNLFNAALKNNAYLKKGILNGILRILKSSMLSGLNHLDECSLLDKQYNQYFGFTDEEVSALFKQAGLTQDSDKVKDWYNGYKIDNRVIYNPWSIMKCLKQNGELRP